MTRTRAWRVAGAMTAAGLLALVALFHETARSMVHIWWRSETFTHCFVVPPVSAYLIWRRRSALAGITPRPELRAVGVMLLLAMAWLLGDATDIVVVQQGAFVGMLIVAAWTILGSAVMRTILFPVGFLFFAVPAGEFLVPPLMEFTGRFAVFALRLTGVPVSVEGNMLRVPNAHWLVAEACSGFRYLMASVTVGTLYAYLMYRRPLRRALFVLASIVMPIPANGVRAYLIVLLGYMSDNKLAVGIDHYLYGWVLFTVGIGLLFWIGSYWRESPASDSAPREDATGATEPARPLRLAGAAAVALVVATIGPLTSLAMERAGREASPPLLSAPPEAGGWRLAPGGAGSWRPDFATPAATLSCAYRRGDDLVGLQVLYYRDQREGAELLSTQNAIVATTDTLWHRGDVRRLDPPSGAPSFPVRETVAYSSRERVRIWDWYWVDGASTSSLVRAKLALGASRLSGRGDDGALVAVFTAERRDSAGATERLGSFVRVMLPLLESSLRAARVGARGGAS